MRTPIIERVPTRRVIDRLPLVDRLNATVEALQLQRGAQTMRDANGIMRDTRMVLPINPWKMRVYLAGAQSIASAGGGGTVIHFDTVDYDATGGFDTTAHAWTVPATGYYVCHLCVTWAPSGTMSYFISNAYIYESVSAVGFSSGNVVNGMTAGSIVTGTNYDVMVGDTVFLTAGEKLQGVTSQQNSAALSQNIVTGQYQTYFTAQLVSG